MSDERIMFIDTETTGLPKLRNVSALARKNIWPDIVSIAWMIYEKGQHIETKYHLVKPNGWLIAADSIRIHGITMEYASNNGVTLESAMSDLQADLGTVGKVVAHNMEFDKNVIFNAYKWRLDTNPLEFWPKTQICTMLKSENELKLPSTFARSKRFKSPSLKELYTDTFKKEPVGMHNSKKDAEILAEIYWARWSPL